MPHRPVGKIIENQRIIASSAQATVSEAAQLMKKHHVGALMVLEDGRLVGIFTERDALFRVIAEGRDAQATRLAEVMTRAPQTIAPHKLLRSALHMMYEGGFRHVPVVDNEKPLGMVSARDVLSSELAEFESDLARRKHIGEILG